MMKCQSRSKSVECSNPKTSPEMFIVYRGQDGGDFTKRTECLAHAVVAEDKGYRVDLILT